MDWLVLIIVFVAIAVGWACGRLSRAHSVSVADLPTSAIKSLTEIINQEPDVAIDQFIEQFRVNAKTFDAHMALGNASRRRGEIEKAIKLHQNLMSRPNLSRVHQDQACLELGRDYLLAGLLDRAESLFCEVIRSDAHNKREAQLLLLTLFEDEHEWQKAIETAKQLLGKRKLMQRSTEDTQLLSRISQLYCELAEQEMEARHYSTAIAYLEDAYRRDKNNQRVTYLKAVIAMQQGDQKQIKILLPALLSESSRVLYASLWMIPAALRGRPKSEVIQFYTELYQRTNSVDVLQLLRESLGGDSPVFQSLLTQHIESRPSLPALCLLVNVKSSSADAVDIDWSMLESLLDSLVSHQKRHRCNTCGFSAKQLFWRCPSCKTWDSMESITGEDFVK